MDQLNDRSVVEQQYATATNLQTRISIHDKYSTNKMGFGNWIFSNYKIDPGMRVLELGCGTGDMWKNKEDLIHLCSRLTLSDFSKAMIAAAKSNIGGYFDRSFCKWNFKRAKRIWHVYRIIEQLKVMEEVSMLNNIEFDLWADGYDKTVGISDEENTYPFAGYKKVLGFIFQTIMGVENAVVLDIGFGTGTLTTKLYERGCSIYGQDFSSRMIALASCFWTDNFVFIC